MPEWIVTLQDETQLAAYQQAGATELLLGVPFFSLRAPRVFALEQLFPLIARIHALGLRASVNCTRFFMEEDLSALRSFLRQLQQAEVDAIYFADEGVLYEAQRLGLTKRLVYQPDTLITNGYDAAFYRRQGCQAVSLAREITLAEIQGILTHSDGVEMLVHGRFSIMHSRRALLSHYDEFLGGTSRSLHGRMDLSLQEESRMQRMPVVEDENGTHIFSEYTLESFAQIEQLVAAGVSRLRIDSIFYDDAWAIAALQDYQRILRQEATPSQVKAKWLANEEAAAYSEGFYYTKTSLMK